VITASSKVSDESFVCDVNNAVATDTHPKQTKRHLHTFTVFRLSNHAYFNFT